MFDLAYRPVSYRDDSPRDKDAEARTQKEQRRMGATVHPAFLGGAYLPDRADKDVDVAVIEMSSTTGDVIVVRAAADGPLIRYRVFDEYETDYDISPEVSERPLKMAALIALIDTADSGDSEFGRGLFDAILDMNAQGTDPRELVDFIRVRSRFYPQLGAYYESRARVWLRRQVAGGGAEGAD